MVLYGPLGVIEDNYRNIINKGNINMGWLRGKPWIRLVGLDAFTSASWEWKPFPPSRSAVFIVRNCRVKRGDLLNVLLPTPAIHNLSFLATVIILHNTQRLQSDRFVSL